MFHYPPAPDDEPIDDALGDGAGAFGEDDAAWERRLLREAAEASADICRFLHGRIIRTAHAGDDAALVPLAGAHARQARALRMNIALLRKARTAEAAARQAADAGAGAGLNAAEAEETRAMVGARLWSLYEKDKIREVAARAIEAEPAEDERERLLGALDARLDDDESAMALADMPISRAIQAVCADLGLEPDWSLWKHQTWAIEAALPGVPRPGPRMYGADGAQGPP
jgi:hypothetical protein